LAAERDQVLNDETMATQEKARRLNDIRMGEIENIEKYYNKTIALAEAELQNQKKLWGEAQGMKDYNWVTQNAFKERIGTLERYIDAQKKHAAEAIKTANMANKLFDGTSKTKTDPVRNKIASLSGDIARLKNGFDEVQGAVDEFDAEVAQGMYPNITKAQKATIKGLIETKAQMQENQKDVEAAAPFWERIRQTGEDARIATESLMNGGLEKRDTQVENYRQSLEAMLATMRKTRGVTMEYMDAQAMLNGAVNDFAKTKQVDFLNDIFKANKEIKQSGMGQDELNNYVFEQEQARIRRLLDLSVFSAEERTKIESELATYKNNLLNKEEIAARGAIKRQLDDWKHLKLNMMKAATGWMDGFIDALVQGEDSFKNFAKAVLQDLAKMIVRARLAAVAMNLIGMYQTGADPAFNANAPSTKVPIFHSGGDVGLDSTMRKVSAGLFNTAQRFHGGGVVGLKPDEQAAILQKGETVLTKAQREAMGGSRSEGMGKIHFNLINQSGVPMTAQQQGGPKFDGERMILDVVISALNKPGKMRDTVKGLK
jgi:hypothetical protein